MPQYDYIQLKYIKYTYKLKKKKRISFNKLSKSFDIKTVQ